MSTTADHPLADIGSSAISDASPCGENARYEPEFEQLEAELAKQESLSSATVDWGKIVDTSALITQGKSKDILVGAYLCYGLLLKEGYGGMAVGLKILSDMAEQHWDCLFPPAKRMRARQTAFAWLAEKAAATIGDKPPSSAESASVVEAMDHLKKLDGILVDKMGDQAPLLTDLSRPLKAYAQSTAAEQARPAEPEPPAAADMPAASPPANAEPAAATPEPEPAPAPAPAPTTPAKPAAVAKPVATGGLETEADSKKQLRQIQAACRDLAAFWLAQQTTDARAYRMARMAAWMALDNPPPATDGVTQINAPAAERLKYFEGKLKNKEYSALLPELEKTLSRSPFWLDGQFMAVQVLRALGPEYDQALQTVINETMALLRRLPQLLDLSFSDRIPFASDQTRLWLQSEALAESSNEQAGAPTATDAGEPWQHALAAASQHAASGNSAEAFELIQRGMRQAGSPRSQSYWRCALADLLLRTGRSEEAADIAGQVSAQLDGNPIADWEPELPAYAYNLLYQSYQRQQRQNKDDETLRDKADLAYARLCWFDPATALSAKGG